MSLATEIKKLRKRVEAIADPSVLIWGSGKGGGEHYAKRVKIRDELKAIFPKADIRFSEDNKIKKAVAGAEFLNVAEQELWHLGACSVCIVLDTSKGSGEEIAHFLGSAYAHKLFILTDEKYKGASSFSAALRANLNQVFYSEDEYKSCRCVERVITHVRQVALGQLSRLSPL